MVKEGKLHKPVSVFVSVSALVRDTHLMNHQMRYEQYHLTSLLEVYNPVQLL